MLTPAAPGTVPPQPLRRIRRAGVVSYPLSCKSFGRTRGESSVRTRYGNCGRARGEKRGAAWYARRPDTESDAEKVLSAQIFSPERAKDEDGRTAGLCRKKVKEQVRKG